MTCEYEPLKAQTNWRKHSVSFAEAEFVFFDPLAIHDVDPDSIDNEVLRTHLKELADRPLTENDLRRILREELIQTGSSTQTLGNA